MSGGKISFIHDSEKAIATYFWEVIPYQSRETRLRILDCCIPKAYKQRGPEGAIK